MGYVLSASVYERNFERLTTLLPGLVTPKNELMLGVGGIRVIKVGVVERHKYTTVIKLLEELPLPLAGVASPVMVVRVYHDAKVAEVFSYQGHFHFSPKYAYPNPRMCQVREKQRVNEFLGEWLDFCILDGFAKATR